MEGILKMKGLKVKNKIQANPLLLVGFLDYNFIGYIPNIVIG